MLTLAARPEHNGESPFDARAIARRSRKLRATSRRLLAESRLVLLESKRILLWNAERRYRITRLAEDARLVRSVRAELNLAEGMYNAELANGQRPTRSAKLRKLYSKLSARGNATVDLLSRLAPRLPPASRFDTAVRVQALEELVDKWREAEGVHL